MQFERTKSPNFPIHESSRFQDLVSERFLHAAEEVRHAHAVPIFQHGRSFSRQAKRDFW